MGDWVPSQAVAVALSVLGSTGNQTQTLEIVESFPAPGRGGLPLVATALLCRVLRISRVVALADPPLSCANASMR